MLPERANAGVRAAGAGPAEKPDCERKRRRAGKAGLGDEHHAREGEGERADLPQGGLLAKEQPREGDREERRGLVKRLSVGDWHEP